jgi:hypothetical protein
MSRLIITVPIEEVVIGYDEDGLSINPSSASSVPSLWNTYD